MKKIFTSYIPAILISSLFIIPIISFSDFFIGIVSGKNYCFYIFMTILIVYNILLYIFNKSSKKISLNKIDFVLLSLIIWNLFTASISQDSYVNEKTSELLLLTIFYFIVKGQLT